MLKSLTTAVVLTALITPSFASFAQTAQPVTRAQVTAELARLQKAGFDPRDQIHYLENLQAATAKVAAEDAAQQTATSGNVGIPKEALRFQPNKGS